MIRSHIWEPKASDPIWKGRVNERSTGHKVRPENDKQIIYNRTIEFSSRVWKGTGEY